MTHSSTSPVLATSPAVHSTRDSLTSLFDPRSIAVIGATERAGTVGRALMRNLLGSKASRRIIPVNPKHKELFGHPSFASITDVPEAIDLAVIATPARTVPDVVQQCVAAGVRSAIILSAGFKELGPEGVALEKKILDIKRQSGLRIIGPNCLGVMNPFADLNATFAAMKAGCGSVAFLSQSGALCSAILDWSLREKVGFSAFVSTGSMLDVSWGDLIDYLADDPHTRSILIYMEAVGEARSFLSAAREAALSKPIVILKAGRSSAAAQAAASHTGAMAGSDEVLDAAFRRAGVLRVDSVTELFYMAEVLSKQPRPTGPRLTIVTNAGGPGVLATDALINAGGKSTPLSNDSIAKLNQILPAHWSHANPIDILGDADATRYVAATSIAANDLNTDGVLVVLTPQEMTDPTAVASALAPYARVAGKPILANWMGGDSVEQGASILREAGMPVFRYPDTAARAFQFLWQYTDNLRALYETPALFASERIHPHEARAIIEAAQRENREILTEAESKQVISAYGIPTVHTEIAGDIDSAVKCANRIGYPVALKLLSKTITHKSDVGGVKLNLANAAEVRSACQAIHARVTTERGAQHFDGVTVQPMVRSDGAYEVIVGSKIDPQFGPVLLFGAGGRLVELMEDHAIGFPPLNATLARRLMEQTRIYRALGGVRGEKPVDLAVIEQLLVRFSQLVLDHPRVKEIEINPLSVSSSQIIALDARIILFGPEVADADLPRAAIRPYPQEYVAPWTLNDGTSLLVRPIRPEDEPLLAEFHTTISETSVQLRYFHAMSLASRIRHERLTRVCFNDYDREICLVAERRNPENDRDEIVGIARLTRLRHSDQAEFAIIISDRMQGRGLGTHLIARLLEIGKREGLRMIVAEILRCNGDMIDLCRRTGFELLDNLDSDVVRVIKRLDVDEPVSKRSE
jgi:acetyltransferase